MIGLLSRNWQLLALLIALVIGVGWLVGALSAPASAWARELVLPPIIIPQPFSSILSLGLSLAYAFVGWRIWLLSRSMLTDIGLWFGILGLSWFFTPAFLVIRLPAVALAIIVAMGLMSAILTVRLWHGDRLSAALMAACTVFVVYTAEISAWVINLNAL